MVKHASEYATQNSWQSHTTDYLKLVDSLCSAEQKRA